MSLTKISRAAGLVALFAMAGCKSLDVTNPNAPDASRALADPKALEAVAGGTMRTWFNTYDGMEAAGVLSTQAQSFSASWNNFNMNFYSSVDADGTRGTRSWQNDPAAAGRTSIQWQWTGYYSTLSSATDVLKAIRTNGVKINNDADTKRAETISLLMSGASLSGIALNYDKGFIVDEKTDLGTLQFSDRKAVRDAAVAKLIEAATLAKANSFTTPAGWTNGIGYSNTQIAQLAYTLAAFTLANYPRNAAENAQVAWATVAQYASQGLSSGSAFDMVFVGDGCSSWCHELLAWFDAFDTGRVHTRIANMLDPTTQANPFPATTINLQPHSADKRMGNGTFGDASISGDFGTIPKDAGAGTDFVFSSTIIFRPDRGRYHQSNIGHIRYDLSGNQDPNGIYSGYGPAPIFTRNQNDLLWAEGLLRSGGSLDQAATLINKSRVGRGGLSAATAADGLTGLLTKLGYEIEIESMGLGAAPFYYRRRIDGLLAGTPHEMPVPAQELGVLGLALYTWGGAQPANSPTPP